MSGYLDDPHLNRAGFVGGWFRWHGEPGRRCLQWSREKELINRG
jgi:hypothetical protein